MDLYNLLKSLAVVGLIGSIISSIGLLYENKKNPKIKYPTAIIFISNILILIGWIVVFYL